MHHVTLRVQRHDSTRERLLSRARMNACWKHGSGVLFAQSLDPLVPHPSESRVALELGTGEWSTS